MIVLSKTKLFFSSFFKYFGIFPIICFGFGLVLHTFSVAGDYLNSAQLLPAYNSEVFRSGFFAGGFSTTSVVFSIFLVYQLFDSLRYCSKILKSSAPADENK